MSRPRNRDGTFKSDLDIAIEHHETEYHAEIKALMDIGLSFNEANIASGGDIIPSPWSKPEDIEEIRKAYEKVGRRQR